MNSLTQTEYMTLRHLLKMSNRDIDIFESFELEDDVRCFIIFDMMLKAQDKQRKNFEKRIAELENTKRGLFERLFRRETKIR